MKIYIFAIFLTFFFLPTKILAEGLNSETLFSLINAHRTQIGKPVVVQEERICQIAQDRAPAVHSEIYGGFMHAGFHKLNLPYWASEIIIDMRTDQEAIRWWLNSYVHRGIIQGDYQYACIGCSGNSCAGVFTNFISK